MKQNPKMMPYQDSYDAEQQVLCSMLLRPSIIPSVRHKVDEGDFKNIILSRIFSVFIRAHAELGDTFDLITLEPFFRDADINCSENWYTVLDITRSGSSAANWVAYCEMVSEFSRQRKIQGLATDLAVAISENRGDDAVRIQAELSKASTTKKRKLFDLNERMNDMERICFTPAPTIEGVFRECLPLNEPALLTAGGGTGKSFTVIQMALSLATGRPVFEGAQPFLTPQKRGKTVIVAAEDGIDDYHRRLHSIFEDNNYSEQDKADVMASILIIPMRGDDVRIIKSDKTGAYITDFMERLAESLAEWGDVRMIALDPMIRFYDAEENSNSHATMFINAANKLSSLVAGKPAVLLVHHSAKHDVGGARGASGFVDGVRTHLSMMTLEQKKKQAGSKDPISADDRNRVVLEMRKSNHFKYWDDFKLLERGQRGTLRAVDMSDEMTSRMNAIKTQERDNIYTLVQAVQGYNGITRSELEKNRAKIVWDHGVPTRDQFRAMIDKIIDDSLVIVDSNSKKLYCLSVGQSTQQTDEDQDF